MLLLLLFLLLLLIEGLAYSVIPSSIIIDYASVCIDSWTYSVLS